MSVKCAIPIKTLLRLWEYSLIGTIAKIPCTIRLIISNGNLKAVNIVNWGWLAHEFHCRLADMICESSKPLYSKISRNSCFQITSSASKEYFRRIICGTEQTKWEIFHLKFYIVYTDQSLIHIKTWLKSVFLGNIPFLLIFSESFLVRQKGKWMNKNSSNQTRR